MTAATVAGTALAGSDFTAKTQVLTFAAGVASVSFVVTIVNNTDGRADRDVQRRAVRAVGGDDDRRRHGRRDDHSTPTARCSRAAHAVRRARSPVSGAELQRAFARAKAAWLRVRPDADFRGVTVVVADLPGLMLGRADGRVITIDTTAAGWGWQRMDLISVLLHELGHVLGLEHDAERPDAGGARARRTAAAAAAR